MPTFKILPVLLLTLSAFTFAQEGAQSNLSRDPNVPPPEWNIQADPLKKGAPSVKDILGRAARVYGAMETYQDHSIGKRTTLSQNTYTRTESITKFDRNADKFWFQSSLLYPSGERARPHLIWKQKDQIKTWSELNNRIENFLSIDAALGDGSYSSNGASNLVPRAFFSETNLIDRVWTSSEHKYRISDVTENGISYFRVQEMVASSYGEPSETYWKITYWIRKKDALLVRVVKDAAGADLKFKFYVSTDYEPIINQPIADSDFEFGH